MIVSKLPDYPKQELNVKEYISNTEIEEDKHFSKEIKELITKEKLDLSICNEEKITINIPVVID